MIQGHTKAVHAVSFSPNDTIIVSASDDKTIKFWDSKTFKIIDTLKSIYNKVIEF